MKKHLCSYLVLAVGLLPTLPALAQTILPSTTLLPIPSLTILPEGKAFATNYPNLAKAVQIDLYAGNLVNKLSNQSYYLDSDDPKKYTPAQLRQLDNCTYSLYTSALLLSIYQQMQTNPKAEMAEAEKFFGTPAGYQYLNAKITVANEVKDKTLLEVENMPDERMIDALYSPEFDKFMESTAATMYEMSMPTKLMVQAKEKQKQCIGKIIGRDIGKFE